MKNDMFDGAARQLRAGIEEAQRTARARFNVRLVARVKALPDSTIVGLTQMDLRLTVDERRMKLIRALRVRTPEAAATLEDEIARGGVGV